MSKEFKIGLIVTSAIFMLYWGANFLSGNNLFNPKDYYYARYENVNGLLVSNEIRYQGFKVGMVDEIAFSPDSTGGTKNWLVKFSVTQDGLTVMDSCEAEISSADILGTMVIELKDVYKGNKPIQPGDYLIGTVSPDLEEVVNEQIKPIKAKLEKLISSADQLTVAFNTVMDEEAQTALTKSINQIPKIVNNIVRSTQAIDSVAMGIKNARIQDIINHVESITRNIKNNNGAITAAIQNINNISDSLAKVNLVQTVQRVNDVLTKTESIVAKIDKGEGTLGLLVNDDKLYKDLLLTNADLGMLLQDLQQNPSRYIHISAFNFGSKKQKELDDRNLEDLKRLFNDSIRNEVFPCDTAK